MQTHNHRKTGVRGVTGVIVRPGAFNSAALRTITQGTYGAYTMCKEHYWCNCNGTTLTPLPPVGLAKQQFSAVDPRRLWGVGEL